MIEAYFDPKAGFNGLYCVRYNGIKAYFVVSQVGPLISRIIAGTDKLENYIIESAL